MYVPVRRHTDLTPWLTLAAGILAYDTYALLTRRPTMSQTFKALPLKITVPVWAAITVHLYTKDKQ